MADAANAGDNVPGPEGGRVEKKRRRKHRQNTLLPNRPKKPMSGYTIFLRNYFNTHPHEGGISSHTMLTRASEQWRNLPADQKKGYQDLCQADVQRYRQAMALWKNQRTVLKRPASAYALFVKDHWQAERQAGRLQGGVKEMGTNCKQAWDQLSDEARQQYRERYNQNAEAYKARIAGVIGGQIQVEDLVNALANANANGAGQGAPAAAGAAANAEAAAVDGAAEEEVDDGDEEEMEDAGDDGGDEEDDDQANAVVA